MKLRAIFATLALTLVSAGADAGPVLGVGSLHSLYSDGYTTWAWGHNNSGQLGDGQRGDGQEDDRRADRNIPGKVHGLGKVVELDGGEGFSVALLPNGHVRAWGDNILGTLGIGDKVRQQPTPETVPGLTDVTTLSCGDAHCLAVERNGGVRGWGNNFFSQLGSGPEDGYATATLLKGLSDVVAVSSGGAHSLALRRNHTVLAWGGNHYGQLGDGEVFQERAEPALVKALPKVKAIAAGGLHSLALGMDGEVYTWGGQLHGGTKDERVAPHPLAKPVTGLPAIRAIAAGGLFSVALAGDGSVWTWGANDFGQLGDGSEGIRDTPAKVQGLPPIAAIAAGDRHVLALARDGSLWAWGGDHYGQLGNGGNSSRNHPVQVRIPSPHGDRQH